MKITDQVCTREQAERLKELGITQDASYFVINPTGEVLEVWMLEGHEDDFCAAFTVAELGLILEVFPGCGHSFYRAGQWYHTNETRQRIGPVFGPFNAEAQARAAMLTHLLENNLLKVEEVNNRLKG